MNVYVSALQEVDFRFSGEEALHGKPYAHSAVFTRDARANTSNGVGVLYGNYVVWKGRWILNLLGGKSFNYALTCASKGST